MFLYSPLAREGLDQLMKEKSPAINGIVISICWFGVHAPISVCVVQITTHTHTRRRSSNPILFFFFFAISFFSGVASTVKLLRLS
jgi:hypothetical protein